MSTEANKAIASRYFNEVFNKGDFKALEEICAPDFLFTLPTHEEPYRGVDGYKGLVNMLRGCFPDIQFAIEDMLAEEDKVMTRWTARGTHTGIPFPTVIGDVPAVGNQFHIEGMSWHHISNGKISEVRANEDSLGSDLSTGPNPLPGPAHGHARAGLPRGQQERRRSLFQRDHEPGEPEGHRRIDGSQLRLPHPHAARPDARSGGDETVRHRSATTASPTQSSPRIT